MLNCLTGKNVRCCFDCQSLVDFAIQFDLGCCKVVWIGKVEYLELGRAGLVLGPHSAFAQLYCFVFYLCTALQRFLNHALLYSSVLAAIHRTELVRPSLSSSKSLQHSETFALHPTFNSFALALHPAFNSFAFALHSSFDSFTFAFHPSFKSVSFHRSQL